MVEWLYNEESVAGGDHWWLEAQQQLLSSLGEGSKSSARHLPTPNIGYGPTSQIGELMVAVAWRGDPGNIAW